MNNHLILIRDDNLSSPKIFQLFIQTTNNDQNTSSLYLVSYDFFNPFTPKASKSARRVWY